MLCIDESEPLAYIRFGTRKPISGTWFQKIGGHIITTPMTQQEVDDISTDVTKIKGYALISLEREFNGESDLYFSEEGMFIFRVVINDKMTDKEIGRLVYGTGNLIEKTGIPIRGKMDVGYAYRDENNAWQFIRYPEATPKLAEITPFNISLTSSDEGIFMATLKYGEQEIFQVASDDKFIGNIGLMEHFFKNLDHIECLVDLKGCVPMVVYENGNFHLYKIKPEADIEIEPIGIINEETYNFLKEKRDFVEFRVDSSKKVRIGVVIDSTFHLNTQKSNTTIAEVIKGETPNITLLLLETIENMKGNLNSVLGGADKQEALTKLLKPEEAEVKKVDACEIS